MTRTVLACSDPDICNKSTLVHDVRQISPACWHLVKAMLRAEIGDRPNVAEVLRHPWMLVDMPPELAALNDRLVQVGAASATTRTRSMMVSNQEFHPAWSPGLIATCSSRWRLCPCGPGVVPATVVPR